MNKQSAFLLLILSNAQPKDEILLKASDYQSIVHSDAYAELSKRKAFSKFFSLYFSEERLKTYSTKELSAIARTIPLIPELVDNIVFSIKNGVGPTITSDDRPDFLNETSIKKLGRKLSEEASKNYTNIAPDEFMIIFEDSTVKSIKNIFPLLSRDCTNYEAEIETLLKGKKYCISSAELSQQEHEYEQLVNTFNARIEAGKATKRKRFLIRFAVSLLCLLIPTVANGLTGMLSSAAVSVCTLVEFALAVIFLFWG